MLIKIIQNLKNQEKNLKNNSRKNNKKFREDLLIVRKLVKMYLKKKNEFF